MEIRCERCNRKLKYPIYINGKPYGKICAEKIKNEEKNQLRVDEIIKK